MSMKEIKGIDITNFNQFGEAMNDGMLTEVSNDNVYRLREAIVFSEKLGRPLTEEELKDFEICDVVAEDDNYNPNSKK